MLPLPFPQILRSSSSPSRSRRCKHNNYGGANRSRPSLLSILQVPLPRPATVETKREAAPTDGHLCTHVPARGGSTVTSCCRGQPSTAAPIKSSRRREEVTRTNTAVKRRSCEQTTLTLDCYKVAACYAYLSCPIPTRRKRQAEMV